MSRGTRVSNRPGEIWVEPGRGEHAIHVKAADNFGDEIWLAIQPEGSISFKSVAARPTEESRPWVTLTVEATHDLLSVVAQQLREIDRRT